MKIEVCPITSSADKFAFLDLGMIPIEGNLSSTREESLKIKKYPMVLQFFPDSKLVSLTETVNSDDIYLNYLYHSSISKPYLEHCSKMADFVTDYVNLVRGSLIADIGGNDGSLLLQFRKKYSDLEYVNVECSKSFVDINQKNNITYINKYFNEATILPKTAKLITSTNVFQHTPPLRSFVKGIYNNLDEEGIWCLEFPYLMSTFINNFYDQAYHEHVYYYCLTAVKKLVEQEGLYVINVSYHDIHTGTLRLIISKNKDLVDNTIESFLNLEKFIDKEYCINWGMSIDLKIEYFRSFFEGLKEQNVKIAGFGAAIKGCVFLNTCKLDYNTIDFIIDDTLEKQGKFVPGTGIEVFSRDILKTKFPDYILILAHNFKDYIIESLRNDGYKGKIIVMFPEIQII